MKLQLRFEFIPAKFRLTFLCKLYKNLWRAPSRHGRNVHAIRLYLEVYRVKHRGIQRAAAVVTGGEGIKFIPDAHPAGTDLAPAVTAVNTFLHGHVPTKAAAALLGQFLPFK